MTVTLQDVIAFLMGPFGTLFLALFILYAGHRKWWVFGWYAEELKLRNERIENRIDRLSTAAKKLGDVAEKTTTLAEKNSGG